MTPRIPHREFDPTTKGALHGVRVIDLSRLVAGNLLTKILADHGAEVIKVEPAKGDTLRAWTVDGHPLAWKTWSRNKKSIALELRHAAAQDIVRKLAHDATVLVESFRPGTLEKMNLAPADLLAANPKLVIVRLSGWGQTGPRSNRPGFGTLAEAYSGFAAVNGFSDREPVLPPMFMADSFAGLHAATATMVALHAARGEFGKGQIVDLSLIDPLLEVLEPQIASFRVTGAVKPRTGSRSGNTAPRNVYPTKDGRWVALSSATQGMVERLFKSIDRPELSTDPRFRDNASRLAHAGELDEIIGRFVSARTLADNLAHFAAHEVTIGPVMDVSDLHGDDYLIDRGSLVEVPDADIEWLPMHPPAAKLSGTPAVLSRAAPLLGQHNAEIIAPLIGEHRFAALVEAGTIIAPGEPNPVRRAPSRGTV